MALGARPARVLGLVVRQSAALAGAGLVCGIPLAVLSGRAMVGQLYGVEPADPSVLAFAAAAIAGSAGVASAIPALRALRVDPVQALRHD